MIEGRDVDLLQLSREAFALSYVEIYTDIKIDDFK